MKYSSFLLLFLLVISLSSENAIAQEKNMLGAEINPDTTVTLPYRLRKKEWTEVVAERTPNSSTFRKADGGIVRYVSREPVNYYDENHELVPINTEVRTTELGWSIDEQPTPFYVDQLGTVHCGKYNKDRISFCRNSKVNGTPMNYLNPVAHDDSLIFREVIPGVDKVMHFRPNAVKYSYIIKNRSGLSQGRFWFSEEVVSEHYIEPDPGFSEVSGEGLMKTVKGHLVAKDTEGKERIRFGTVYCYDANGNSTVASYQLFPFIGYQSFIVTVPDAWLNDPARVFPIVVDPLVTGPTSTYPSLYMPSCFAPAYNVDSILVTVPAAITVTALNVTGNYYANPFTTTVMADGQMYFSTNCASSTTFTVTPANGGNVAGTAYLQAYNLKSPLMCCLPQSCSQQTFYLRMHISRTSNGPGCNTNYLYYDPFNLWPFSAYIEGYTPETFSGQMTINPTTLCSNVCDFTANIYARYGVPPYTFTHPWAPTPVVAGTPAGCSLGNQLQQLQLVNPNCPNDCDPTTSVVLPVPVVTDACGAVISGYPAVTLNLKPVPDVTSLPDSVVLCDGEDVDAVLTACLAGSNIFWSGALMNGTGNLHDTLQENATPTILTTYYSAWAELNGCYSDTIQIPVTIEPHIDADFTTSPAAVFVAQATAFNDVTQTAGTLTNWFWDFGDGTTDNIQNSSHTFASPGDYTVCFSVSTSNSCVDTVCKIVTVLPLEIIPPNVFTPNGDGINDSFEFPYLEFYPSSHLQVFDRWGIQIYEKSNYANDWKADGYPDGVYFFILQAGDQDYSGFVHITRQKN